MNISFWVNCKPARLRTNAIMAIISSLYAFLLSGENFRKFVCSKISCIKEIDSSCCIFFSFLALIFIYTCVYFIVLACLLFKDKIRLFKSGERHSVFVHYGDIFNDKIIGKKNERYNIVIAVNRCFDTIVDDDLISSRSLHGILFNRLYQEGIYDQDSLYKEIQNYFQTNSIKSTETISKKNKRKGNNERYPIGTIAEISIKATKRTYFLLGLTRFNKNLHAELTDVEFDEALVKLLRFCSSRSQGFPVIMPLIGSHCLDGKSEQDILTHIVEALRFHKDIMKNDFHIVVSKNAKEDVSILNLAGE